MVIASRLGVGAIHLAHGCSAELAAPDHKSRIEHSPLLEILQQRSRRLVGDLTVRVEAFIDFVVMIPTSVLDHDESDSPLHHSPREQTVDREGMRRFLVYAVGFQHAGRLF